VWRRRSPSADNRRAPSLSVPLPHHRVREEACARVLYRSYLGCQLAEELDGALAIDELHR
jgi:hypothetical protein